ncbi:anti-sigma B factor antagonist [Aneurinibacillus soli]|uniref:STAS domain protein n=1 Tax=Aneurinibacillus soli TaxID=1500254 RepID=A0A0U5BE30_9BACL|nr:STAS domain-containing protein [Aneurinibacillus soli]PYE60630.1 anti-sigma B factor antagonist [Aneurinibacillus soli]BAU29846.1 STAS domain protein [Aneurinibacillus soli]
MDNYTQDQNEIRVAVHSVNQYQKITLSGKLIYGKTNEVKEKIIQMLTVAEGYIFDANGLKMIDSTGLGMLVTVVKQIKKQNCPIVIVVKPGIIRELFMIAKFDLIFSIVESEDEALQILSNEGSSCLPLDDY